MAGLLIEDQAGGLDMHGTLARVGRRTGSRSTGDSRDLKIDLDCAVGADDALYGIVVEVVPVYVVHRSTLRAVKSDADIVQDGMSAALVLDCLGGVKGKESTAALGLRKGKPIRRLLNLNTQLARQIAADSANLPPRIGEKEQNANQQHSREPQNRPTQSLHGDAHTSIFSPAATL